MPRCVHCGHEFAVCENFKCPACHQDWRGGAKPAHLALLEDGPPPVEAKPRLVSTAGRAVPVVRRQSARVPSGGVARLEAARLNAAGAVGPPAAPPAVFMNVRKEPPPKVEVDPALVRAAEQRKKAFAALERGHALAQQGKGKAKEALDAYHEALKYEPKLASAERGLGVVYAVQGDAEKAVKHYRRYLEMEPKAKGAEKLGYEIVARAVEAPLRQIAETAGFDGDLAVETVKDEEGDTGLNAATGDYVDLVKAGIIDPALVAKQALINAASVSGLMLTTDVLVTDLKEDAEEVAGATA